MIIKSKYEILNNYLIENNVKEKWPSTAKFTYDEFLNVISTQGYSLAKELKVRNDYLAKFLNIFWNDRPKTGSHKICQYILSLSNNKTCSKCLCTKSLDDFGVNNTQSSGVSTWCKVCMKNKNQAYRDNNKELSREQSRQNYYNHKSDYIKRNIERKLHTTLATPLWANLDSIKKIYAEAGERHVDHIIPLKGELVCGLHVENNLQYLSAEENIKKGNKFEI